MRLISNDARRDLWIFFGLALLLIASGIGLRDPWPADEPRFALVAKQMVEQGQWLIPHRGVELYSDKPPAFMASQAVAYLVTGSWRVAFLLPSLLAALGTLWLVYDLGRRLWTRRVGLYAAYALLFALQFTFQAKKAQIDPSVTFWITLACYGLLRHLLRGPDWRMLWLGFFAAGVGVITKGVGALALLMLLPYALARWQGWPGLAPLGGWRGWIAPLWFVGALALWLGPMLLAVLTRDDPELHAYAHDILFRQTAQRYTDSWDHHNPWWYFLGVIATMWLPAALALPWALPAWARRLRRRDPRYLLPLGWALLLLVFFSIPDGKRDVYLMPALPMVCLALAPLLPGILRKAWPRRLAMGMTALFALLGLVAGTLALTGDPGFKQRLIAERGFAPDDLSPWLLLLALGVAATLIGLLAGRRRPLAGLLGTLTAVWLLFSLWGYPLLNPSSSASDLMDRAGAMIGPQAELALVAWKEQNLLQADRPAVTFGFNMPWAEQRARAIDWLREAPAQRWVLILDQAMGDCIDPARAREVGQANRRGWWLFQLDAVRPDCAARD